MSEKPCPFCYPDAQRIFHGGRLVLGLRDAFPVNPGHALLIPKRHVATWFDATDEEKAELLSAVDIARKEILARHEPDGSLLSDPAPDGARRRRPDSKP